MIDRRKFNALLGGTVAMPATSRGRTPPRAKIVFYGSVGPELTLYDIDVDDAALAKRSTVTLRPTSSTPGRTRRSNTSTWCRATAARARSPATKHIAQRVPHRSGHGRADAARRAASAAVAADPRQRRRSRRISADRLQQPEQRHRASHQAGRHDRRAGEPAEQAGHRHLRAPDPAPRRATAARSWWRAATTPRPASPEDPGALKIYGFKNGVLTNLRLVAAGQRPRLRAAPPRLPPDAAVGVRLGRAPEPALRLPAASPTAG